MASSAKRRTVILLADDDPDDVQMTRRALEKNQLGEEIYTVGDGEELLDFLNHRGKFAPPALSPTPSLVLLDLNMPKMDGREALVLIRADPKLRRLPVVVMTTSTAEKDILRVYDIGANSFISKPISLAELVEITGVLGQYWFHVVTAPPETSS